MLLQEPVHLSGVVHTPEGTIVKGKGCRVSKPFGPLKEWKVLYSKTGAQVCGWVGRFYWQVEY
jgi:hypothetical protein